MRLLASLLAVVAVALCAIRASGAAADCQRIRRHRERQTDHLRGRRLSGAPVDVEAARLRLWPATGAFEQELSRLRQEALIGLVERQLILSEFAIRRLPIAGDPDRRTDQGTHSRGLLR
jgi:hypothetical protein